MKRFDQHDWKAIERIGEWVKRRNEKEQREYYEREANRSALLWLGLVLLLSVWIYAEYKHMEREQRIEQAQ